MLGGEDEYSDEFRALSELAEALTDVVATPADRGTGGPTAGEIVGRAARWMPRGQFAAIVGWTERGVGTVAATSRTCALIDRIRRETAQGPALDVIETNELVVSDNLAEDLRWPAFGQRAVDEAGVVSLVAYRVYLGGDAPAALTFYSDWPQAFDHLAIATGSIFAAYVSLATSRSDVASGGSGPVLSVQAGRAAAPPTGPAAADASAVQGQHLVVRGLRRAAHGMERAADAYERVARSQELLARSCSSPDHLTRAREVRERSRRSRCAAAALWRTLDAREPATRS
jgi:hypothetical protein